MTLRSECPDHTKMREVYEKKKRPWWVDGGNVESGSGGKGN